MNRPSPLHRWWTFLRLTWSPRPPQTVLSGRYDPAPGVRKSFSEEA